MKPSFIKHQMRLYYTFLAFKNLSMVSAVMSLYLEANGLSLYQIGLLYSSKQVFVVLLELPTGFFADKRGNRHSLMLALIFQIISYLTLLCVANSFLYALLAMFFLGLSHAMTTGCSSALITNILVKHGHAELLVDLNATSRVINYCGYGVSALLSGFIAAVDYLPLFGLSIVALLLALLAVGLMCDVEIDKSGTSNNLTVRKTVGYVFHNRAVLYYSLIEAAVAWSMVPVDNFYNIYLVKQFDLPLSIVGIVITCQFVLVSFVGFFSKRISGRIKETNLVRIGPIVMILFFICFALCKNAVFAVLCYLLGLAVFCLVSPTRSKLLNLGIESKYRATVLSFSSILVSALSSISEPLFGALSDGTSIKQGMLILLLVSFASLACVDFIFSRLGFGWPSDE